MVQHLERRPAEDLRRIRDTLAQHGLKLLDGAEADLKLVRLRNMYEPYIFALASYLLQPLPPWIPVKTGKDNWQTTAWAESSGVSQVDRAAVAEHPRPGEKFRLGRVKGARRIPS